MWNPFKVEHQDQVDLYNQAYDAEPHIHSWDTLTKTYASPRKEITNTSLPAEIQEKLLFGVTTLLSECTDCHQRITEQLIGSDENPLDDILDKVDQFGPQYINQNNGTYLVAKYNPVTNDIAAIPVR